MGGAWHLVKRFITSLDPRPPSPEDVAWADANLLAGEQRIWTAMSRADRRHSVAVARRTAAALGETTPRPVLAAALLHDAGKTQSGLGTFRRSGATIMIAVIGHRRARSWAGEGSWRGRLGRYADHARLGSEALAAAGSDPLTVAWAAEHHLPRAAWTVPRHVGDALAAADDD